jgi:hypothetical protein
MTLELFDRGIPPRGLTPARERNRGNRRTPHHKRLSTSTARPKVRWRRNTASPDVRSPATSIGGDPVWLAQQRLVTTNHRKAPDYIKERSEPFEESWKSAPERRDLHTNLGLNAAECPRLCGQSSFDDFNQEACS